MSGVADVQCLTRRAQRVAIQLMEQQDLSTIPVDLRRLFGSLGVEGVTLDPNLGCSGVLYQGSKGWIIGLNAKDNRTRQRFSCAHELAHLVVEKVMDELPDEERSSLQSRAAEREIERACDDVAALFVIPPAVLCAWDLEAISVERLLALAEAARVSPDAAAARAIAASSQPVTFVKWRRATRPGSNVRAWRAWWIVRSGTSKIYFPPNKSAPTLLSDAFEQFSEGRMVVEVPHGSRTLPVNLEFVRRGGRDTATILSILQLAEG